MGFRFTHKEIPEIVLVEMELRRDERGFFRESYRRSEFAANGIATEFVQDNHSRSARGVIRGLHYQKRERAQGKLITVCSGAIFDVAVDIRKGSPTYGKWVGQILSLENANLLYVPPGFAHGFCAITDQADVLYKVTGEYAPDFDRGILWNDPDIGVVWPVAHPSLSPKDARLPRLRDADVDFVYEPV